MEISPPTQGLLGGRYQIEEPLGWGGAGEVWQGRHVELGARVAIKLLRPGLTLSARARRRFLNEARVMAQLNTSHAIRVHDIGVSDEGLPFLVMELVDGETLAQKLRRERKLQPGTAVRLLGQAARGLERAHAMGIVHRDFKPGNILLSVDEDGLLRARVTDFGMAKLLRALEEDSIPGQETTQGGNLTGVVGTPYYMAPEQFSPEQQVSPQTDVWALGVVLYECLTGRRPFEGETMEAIRAAILRGRAAPPSSLNRALPTALDGWFSRACARAPEERFISARFAIEALSDALEVSAVLLPQAAISAKIELLERLAERQSERPVALEGTPERIDPLAITMAHRARKPPVARGGFTVGLALLSGAALASFFWVNARSVPQVPPREDRLSSVGVASVVPAPSAAPLRSANTRPIEAPSASVIAAPGAPPVPPASASGPRFVPGPLVQPGVPAEYKPFPELPAAPRFPASFKKDPYAEDP